MAGEVAGVGNDVKRFKVGDRVLAFSRAAEKEINDSAQGAFQEHTVAYKDLTSRIPADLGFEKAATLHWALPQSSTRNPRERLLLYGVDQRVWDAMLQLAVAAGYEVFSTASPRKHELARKLIATNVWDYKSKTAVRDKIAAPKGEALAGAVSIGAGAADKCISILQQCRLVSMITFPIPHDDRQSFLVLRTAVPFLYAIISFKIRSMFQGLKYNLVAIGLTLENGVAREVFTDFWPKAQEADNFVTSFKPGVVGNGVECIQSGFALLRKEFRSNISEGNREGKLSIETTPCILFILSKVTRSERENPQSAVIPRARSPIATWNSSPTVRNVKCFRIQGLISENVYPDWKMAPVTATHQGGEALMMCRFMPMNGCRAWTHALCLHVTTAAR
ncbi:hypothetical protein N7470_003470 [Penicillium chermesinum]|nr:hypothetical protein N7470_003470 [Penicillium chermesinum]